MAERCWRMRLIGKDDDDADVITGGITVLLGQKVVTSCDDHGADDYVHR